MEELRHAIDEAAIAATDGGMPDNAKLYPDLQQAAEKWGVHSLRCYQGESLNRALAISRAIVDFVEEISKS